MANSRDFTGKNRKFKGTAGIVLPKGSTGQRAGTESGEFRFNTSTNLAEYYDGTSWKPIDAPPTITNFNIDGAGNVTSAFVNNVDSGSLTIVVNGSVFDTTSGTINFISNTGTTVNTASLTRTSANQFSCTVLKSSFLNAEEPYDLRVTNGSGLAATLADAIFVDSPPSFDTASGSLGSTTVGSVISGSTFDCSATDAESDTITYSISSGSLPTGLSISSSTGLVTGTVGGSSGTFTFTVQAATTQQNTTRSFSITVASLPSGGTISTAGGQRYHLFTGSGSFVVAANPISSTVDYLLVGGGGAASIQHSSGAGAGGLVFKTGHSITAQTYTIGVGGGATVTSNLNSDDSYISTPGASGTNSTAFGATALGGGGGWSWAGGNTRNGISGGSGGAPSTSSPGQVGFGQQPGQAGDSGTYGFGNNSGGGGGAGGGAGGTGGGNGGTGGAGKLISQFSQFGANSGYFAGGGGGGDTTSGPGGIGGGGGNVTPGQSFPPSTGNGTANTGGGGGGCTDNTTGGSGGSGVCIIRYPI
jgi:hypothetical protein